MKYTAILVLILCAGGLFAQEETLLGSNEIENGGYGALVIKFTPVNNNLGVLVGARGGWIINHTFSLGLAGYGLTNNVKARTVGPVGQQYVDLGYGGLDLEYVFNSDKLVHTSVHALVGAGAVGFRNPRWEDDGWSMDGGGWPNAYHDAFFVFEPGVNVDLNITTWFRTSVGAAYRVVSGVSSDAAHNSDLTGPSAMLTFRFGAF